MFKNYFKMAFRNFIKHKIYSVINVLGLAIGMAACILILVYIQDELSYDTFHEKAKRIYRITDHWTAGNVSEDLATVPFPVAKTLELENPDMIEHTVRMYRPSSWNISPVIGYEDKTFIEKGIMFADSSFFKLFSFEFIQGTEAALQKPGNVVITEEIAQKYFGQENPLGQRISFNNQLDLEVAGVLKNVPHNSHIQFDILLPMGALRNWWNNSNFEQNWIWQGSWTYLLLNDPSAAYALQQQMPDFVERHFPPSIKDGTILTLQPMLDIHLHSQRYLEIATNGNILYVYIFSAIALQILLIACINFMNLATARSASRAKEVGMRKVMGAQRTHLVRQFLGESILMSFFALILSIAFIELAMPVFNTLTGKSLEIHYFENWVVIVGLITVGLLVGIIAGSYPAFVLSGFRPIGVLKGGINSGNNSLRGEALLRKILVVAQFVVSLSLLISISIIYNQLNYVKNKELGFNKEQVVFFNMFGPAWQQFSAFKNELLQHKDIQAVSQIGGSIPGLADGIANAYVPEGMSKEKPKWIGTIFASHDIEDVLGLEMAAGRFFSTEFPTDSSEAFIINEAAAKEFDWAEDDIGKKLERVRSDGSVSQSGRVIGIVKNFHYQPLREKLKPLVIRFGGGQFVVRLGSQNIPQAMDHIRDSWGSFFPEWPLNYRFLDEDLDRL
ncbi:MAG: FtsX-like permease family protein, partial [Phycisphaerae bacterium]|nr:FtsX-like permease family protein [Phycisphaerae bacterium]